MFFMEARVYESKEEPAKREVLSRIQDIGLQRSDGRICKCSYFYFFCSCRLGVYGLGFNIDTLCVRTSYVNQEHDFFFVLHNSLAEEEEVIGLQLVLDARVPVLKLKFDGISIDLLYARICLLVVPQDVDVSDVLVFYNVDEPTV
ncbi:hypothetical protein SCA6_011033 [Theobroma cacao]